MLYTEEIDRRVPKRIRLSLCLKIEQATLLCAGENTGMLMDREANAIVEARCDPLVIQRCFYKTNA
jgi:hypothetical protein